MTQISERLQLNIKTAKHHVAIMRQSGIVECRRLDNRFIYRLNPDVHIERDSLDFGCCKFRMLGDAC
jgi:predicted transcriptional regulator